MAKRRSEGVGSSRQGLQEMEYSEIAAAGTYVLKQTGLLLRVPPEGVVPGRSPQVMLSGTVPVRVSRLSEDPALPLHRARAIASNHDLLVRF